MALSSREYRSPTALATYVGLVVGLYGVATNKIMFLCGSLAFIVIVLLVTILLHFERYIRIRDSLLREKNIRNKLCKLWHLLAHDFRDYTDFVRTSLTAQEAGEQAAKMFEQALNHCSTLFFEFTNRDCVSSLMFPTTENLKLLRTSYYSHNVQAERKSHRSKSLPIDGGIIGKAFATEGVVSWTKGDPQFVPIRENHESYYNSGIVIPFKVGYRWAGVLCIDSVDERVFNTDAQKQAGCAIADTIGAVLGALELYRTANQ